MGKTYLITTDSNKYIIETNLDLIELWYQFKVEFNCYDKGEFLRWLKQQYQIKIIEYQEL